MLPPTRNNRPRRTPDAIRRADQERRATRRGPSLVSRSITDGVMRVTVTETPRRLIPTAATPRVLSPRGTSASLSLSEGPPATRRRRVSAFVGGVAGCTAPRMSGRRWDSAQASFLSRRDAAQYGMRGVADHADYTRYTPGTRSGAGSVVIIIETPGAISPARSRHHAHYRSRDTRLTRGRPALPAAAYVNIRSPLRAREAVAREGRSRKSKRA